MKKVAAIVLAAGLGKRMRSLLPKVLHPVCGKPMLFYPLEVLKALKVEKTVVVVGHGGDAVRERFAESRVSFVTQEKQLGTGHAVRCAERSFQSFTGELLILSGDVPLIQSGIISELMRVHRRRRAVLSLVTMALEKPTGYGRIIRNDKGAVERVVEEKDAAPDEMKVGEVNAGLYLVDARFLFANLKRLTSRNAQGEYYLPDLIPLALKEGETVAAVVHREPQEVMGVNNRVELAEANTLMRERINSYHMMRGVTMVDPRTTYIDYGIAIGRDTLIAPNVFLKGATKIGPGCTIEEGAGIIDSSLDRAVEVKPYSVIEQSKVGREGTIGPLARLRPGSVILPRAKVGNFVEIKNATIGHGSKVNHLSYIGDTDMGRMVNVGAGTITCNYDGQRKYRTVIKDGAFIGSDTQLVAPVTVGRGAYVGAGSTITKDVPSRALALSRTEQKNLEGWAEKKAGKKKGR